MRLRKSRMGVEEIKLLYWMGVKMTHIESMAGVSRQAVYGMLKVIGVMKDRREVLTLRCLFCGEVFDRPRSHVKSEGSGYCCSSCYHADRSMYGEYGEYGGALSRSDDVPVVSDRQLGRIAVRVLSETGIVLEPGEVVHHRNGDRRDFGISNLKVFRNQSEHMKYHHGIRKAKYNG